MALDPPWLGEHSQTYASKIIIKRRLQVSIDKVLESRLDGSSLRKSRELDNSAFNELNADAIMKFGSEVKSVNLISVENEPFPHYGSSYGIRN